MTISKNNARSLYIFGIIACLQFIIGFVSTDPLDALQCINLEATSLTLIQHCYNVVWPVCIIIMITMISTTGLFLPESTETSLLVQNDNDTVTSTALV